MAIVLAYKIEPEPSQPPKSASPIPSKNYTNIHTHWSHATTPHTPPIPAGVAPLTLTPTTCKSSIVATKPVVIPQPSGWKIITPPPDPEETGDAETIWNTQFNSRRTVPRTHTTASPLSEASSTRSTASNLWLQARRRKRVSFARNLETTIPPECTDLVLYGAHSKAFAPRISYWARYWRSGTGRYVQGGLWVIGFVIAELILLVFIIRKQKRGGVGIGEWHDDNF